MACASPLLDTAEVISAKTQMLDNLLEIEVAYSLLKEEEGGTSDPLDAHYHKLKTDLEVGLVSILIAELHCACLWLIRPS